MELARKGCTELQTGRVTYYGAETSVKKVSTSKNMSSQKSYSKSHIDQFVEPDVKPAGRCSRIGGKHSHRSCQFKDSKCHKCSTVGHIACQCNSRFKKIRHVDDGVASESDSEGELHGICTVTDESKEVK